MKSFVLTPKNITNSWYVVDAEGKTLGRLATKLAYRLRGKHIPEYTPHINMGVHLIVINADKIVVTGNKYHDKLYQHYSGYVGGIKQKTFKDMISSYPERIIKIAVKGMLPKGPQGNNLLRKLKIYSGSTHRHTAQQPQILNL